MAAPVPIGATEPGGGTPIRRPAPGPVLSRLGRRQQIGDLGIDVEIEIGVCGNRLWLLDRRQRRDMHIFDSFHRYSASEIIDGSKWQIFRRIQRRQIAAAETGAGAGATGSGAQRRPVRRLIYGADRPALLDSGPRWRADRCRLQRLLGSRRCRLRLRLLDLGERDGRFDEIEIGQFQLDAFKIQLEIMAGEGIFGFRQRALGDATTSAACGSAGPAAREAATRPVTGARSPADTPRPAPRATSAPAAKPSPTLRCGTSILRDVGKQIIDIEGDIVERSARPLPSAPHRPGPSPSTLRQQCQIETCVIDEIRRLATGVSRRNLLRHDHRLVAVDLGREAQPQRGISNSRPQAVTIAANWRREQLDGRGSAARSQQPRAALRALRGASRMEIGDRQPDAGGRPLRRLGGLHRKSRCSTDRKLKLLDQVAGTADSRYRLESRLDESAAAKPPNRRRAHPTACCRHCQASSAQRRRRKVGLVQAPASRKQPGNIVEHGSMYASSG
jgi:hypothetical protein